MERLTLNWHLGYSRSANTPPDDFIPAHVPGAVQLDYGQAHGYPPYNEGLNFRNYGWMEDVYWFYTAPLQFTVQPGGHAYLHFDGIDYAYRIRVDDEILLEDEGMFSRIHLDVTRFSGGEHRLEVLLFPVPKADNSNKRDQQRRSVKSAACYGWDWHPRLVTSGIWDEAYVQLEGPCALESAEAFYRLSDDFGTAYLTVEARTAEDGPVRILLTGPDGETVCDSSCESRKKTLTRQFTVKNVRLWNPVGYGEQNLYTLCVSTDGGRSAVKRRLGFRRSRLLMNEGTWSEPPGYPKSRSAAPITVTINGRKIFAKGSNYINTEIFPSLMTEERYRTLLTACRDCNMNILRVWGGGFINKECFYDLCDELGILVWQEFPLACNEYPDDPAYLRVLEKEATAIVRRLRTHPCLAFWCGGNELFNVWSGMTDQHHALRLLNALTFREDRFTPFLMTAPLCGMGHGPYANVNSAKKEILQSVQEGHFTACSEFGCMNAPSMEQLLQIASRSELDALTPQDEVWKAHQNFSEWRPGQDHFPDLEYFFGGYDGLEDFIRKERFLGAMCYRSVFEELRRQWPYCSMALNWCFNDVWPKIITHALVTYPDVPSPAYYAVQKALRPQMASLKITRQLWRGGEEFTGEVFLLNDALTPLAAGHVTAFLDDGSGEKELGSFRFDTLTPQTNIRLGAVSCRLPEEPESGLLRIALRVEDRPEMNSEYEYVLRRKQAKMLPGTFLNVN